MPANPSINSILSSVAKAIADGPSRGLATLPLDSQGHPAPQGQPTAAYGIRTGSASGGLCALEFSPMMAMFDLSKKTDNGDGIVQLHRCPVVRFGRDRAFVFFRCENPPETSELASFATSSGQSVTIRLHGEGSHAPGPHSVVDGIYGQYAAAMTPLITAAPMFQANELEYLLSAASNMSGGQGSSAAWRPFPLEVLPPVAREFATEVARVLGVDPVFAAAPALTAIGLCVGRSRALAINDDLHESASLWVSMVAYSGTGKSPSMKYASKILRQIDSELDAKNAEADEKYVEDKDRYEVELRQWKSNEAQGERPKTPKPPPKLSLMMDDVTVEGVARELGDNPRGLGRMLDELSSHFDGLNQYKAGGKGNDEQRWLDIFDGAPSNKTRADATIKIPKAFVAIYGGIQPDVLRETMTPRRFVSGMASRFLYAMPPYKEMRPTHEAVNGDVKQRFANLLRTLFAWKMPQDEHGKYHEQLVSLSSAARQTYTQWCDRNADEQSDAIKKGERDRAAALAKMQTYFRRLALVIHCGRVASGEPVDPLACDDRSINAAATLADWFAGQWDRVYAMISSNQTVKVKADTGRPAILEFIEKKGGTVTIRDIYTNVREFKNKPDKAKEALSKLVELGYILRANDGSNRYSLCSVAWDHIGSFSAPMVEVKPSNQAEITAFSAQPQTPLASVAAADEWDDGEFDDEPEGYH